MIRVMQTVYPSQKESNPYVTLLWNNIPEDIALETFSWKRVLFARIDVVHFHWPEELLRQSGGLRTVLAPLLFFAMLIRLRLSRIAIVRTRHNLSPHESLPFIGRRLLRKLDKLTAIVIDLNGADEQQDPRDRVILHSDYRSWFSALDVPISSIVQGSITYFGFVRKYKNVPALIEAFCKLSEPEFALSILGKPDSASTRADVETAAGDDPRIVLNLGYISDQELAAILYKTELVVLPYSDMYNSGAALLALSLDTPILVPRTPQTVVLRNEVGSEWVHFFDDAITANDIRETVLKIRASDSTLSRRPDLSQRDWQAAGIAHQRLYREAVGQVRGRS